MLKLCHHITTAVVYVMGMEVDLVTSTIQLQHVLGDDQCWPTKALGLPCDFIFIVGRLHL